jgi:hypothetical protein
MNRVASLIATIFLVQLCTITTSIYAQTEALHEYAGRYSDGQDYAVYFENTKYGLTIKPVMWSAIQLLRQNAKDKFEVTDRTSRRADFTRDDSAKVTGVVITGMDGEGLELVRTDGPPLPVELFLSGRTREAAAAYIKRGPEGNAKALETAGQVLQRLPTQTANVVTFLTTIAPHFESDARFHSLLGTALVQAGNRRAGLTSFKLAYKLDQNDKETNSALARLGALPETANSEGWKLPFPIASVFAKPTTKEIKAVEADWAARNLDPAGVREEVNSIIKLGNWNARIRIISHLVHGSRHYGAIIYSENAGPRSCPVIVMAKGVSPTFFPLNLNDSSETTFMGDLSDRFVFVYPSFRGEVLNFRGRSFTSEGDRRNALDGATDDAIALLNVALQTTPAADPDRICAYGHSRGGNVALLAGIRDKRIDCVVDLAGPTDWFQLMGTSGWTEQELWTEALRTRAAPQEPGGQNVERFLMKAIEGKADLTAVRHNMIASSPLYFPTRLPFTQLHYGIEDPFVPVRNGLELVAQLRRHNVPAARYETFFYPGQGHDTDRLAAPISARKFLARLLKVK